MGSFFKKLFKPAEYKAEQKEKRLVRGIMASEANDRAAQLAAIPPPPKWVTAPGAPVNGGAPGSGALADELARQQGAAYALELQELEAQDALGLPTAGVVSLEEQEARADRERSTSGLLLAGGLVAVGVVIFVWGKR